MKEEMRERAEDMGGTKEMERENSEKRGIQQKVRTPPHTHILESYLPCK